MSQKFNIDQLEMIIESISDEKLKITFTYLLNFIEGLHTSNKKLQRENQELRNEVNRLKGEQGKPNIKANSKSKYKDISTNGQEKKQQKHQKQAKKENIPVDETEYIKINKSQLPSDTEFKYWDDVITQDIIFERRNTLYKVAVYYSPSEKKTYRAKMPAGASYHSDGLKSFAILQNKVCDVTSKKLLTMLQSIGIEISTGSLSKILLEHTDLAGAEKTAILKAGLSHSYSQTDITGARVAGKNHYTHIITNEFFTSYTTLAGKSTLDVLAAFQTLTDKNELGLIYSEKTSKLLEEAKVSVKDKNTLKDLLSYGQKFTLQEFEEYIEKKIPDLYNKKNIFIKVKTAFALAYYHSQNDIPRVNCLVSDNAPEYNKIAIEDHALCWVHDARPYKKLTPLIDTHRKILGTFMQKYWSFYHNILDYKDNSCQELAVLLDVEFDKLFTPNTDFFQLNQCITKTAEKKRELLIVFKHPEIPLHNNLAELGARRQVRKRDISLHTMTIEGTKNQDAFMTIGQTAIQLGVDVFKYIKELIANHKNRTTLADIIFQKAYYNTS